MSDETESAEPYKFTLGPESDGVGALEKAAQTTQLEDRHVTTNIGGGITPPYPPYALAAFLELNETHAACVQKLARWEVGFGLSLEPTDEAGEDAAEEQRNTLEGFWFGDESQWKTGPEGSAQSTPTEVLELARQDYHAIGWAALEILTRTDGTPVGLAHVPAASVRVRRKELETEDGEVVIKRGVGYVQRKAGETVYFGEAGDRYDDDPRFVDREFGDIAEDARELPQAPANELIFIPNPSPLSTYYGIPDWISAVRTIAGDNAARDYNRVFFENETIPRMAIVVKGGELTEQTRADLRKVLENLKGSPHRTVVLEVEKFVERQFDGDQEIDVELEPLGVQSEEDMSFLNYREWNESEVLKVHEVPPILIGNTEDSNRANSKEQIDDFANDVVAPEQEKFAGRLYETIHKIAFDAPDWTLGFELRGADNRLREAQIARERIEASQGVMRLNEARQELDLPPVNEPIGDAFLFELAEGGGVSGAIEQEVENHVEQARENVESEFRVDHLLNDD